MRWWLAVFALGGCSRIFGLQEPVVAGDASSDSVADGASDVSSGDAFLCYGTSPFLVCTLVVTTADFTVTSSSPFDTSSGCDLVVPAGGGLGGACVHFYRHMMVLGKLTATGPRPLVLAADTIDITGSGTIDVSSVALSTGAGADSNLCITSGTFGTNGSGTAGGGAGGTFGGRGGNGGQGANGSTNGGNASTSTTIPSTLRGGCQGGDGGDGGGGAALRGNGGGAVALLSRGDLVIDGIINASGQGGPGGISPSGGGGGGGSGGMIVLSAPMIVPGAGAVIFANGGGGGGGASAGLDGSAGAEPLIANMPAGGGGPGNSNGGIGGDGAVGGQNATAGMAASGGSNGAGGGGGGGVGVIRVPSGQSLPVGQVSPPPS